MHRVRQNRRLCCQKRKKKDKDKDNHATTILAQATDDLKIPPGVKQALIPISLEEWTKKTQTCTTKMQQPKNTKVQEPKNKTNQLETLKKQLQESKDKAKKLSSQNKKITKKNNQLESENEGTTVILTFPVNPI